jgi:hypothetical protein
MSKYYQVVLLNGKNYPSIYKSITTAIKQVGIKNIKEIKELRAELVDSKYLEQAGTSNIE